MPMTPVPRRPELGPDPIFLLGMSRGGTTQVFNILSSHPDVFVPDKELGQVLFRRYPRSNPRQVLRHLPLSLALLPHRRVPEHVERLAGWRWRMAETLLAGAAQRHWPRLQAERSSVIVHGSGPGQRVPHRFAVKVMNRAVRLAPFLQKTYPKAKFVAVIRDGRANCEGLIARGSTAEKAARSWTRITSDLDALTGQVDLDLIHFEDLLAKPEETVRRVWAFCGLPEEGLQGLVMVNKTRKPDGSVDDSAWRKEVVPFDKLQAYFRRDVDEKAIARLTANDLATIESICAEPLGQLRYT